MWRCRWRCRWRRKWWRWRRSGGGGGGRGGLRLGEVDDRVEGVVILDVDDLEHDVEACEVRVLRALGHLDAPRREARLARPLEHAQHAAERRHARRAGLEPVGQPAQQLLVLLLRHDKLGEAAQAAERRLRRLGELLLPRLHLDVRAERPDRRKELSFFLTPAISSGICGCSRLETSNESRSSPRRSSAICCSLRSASVTSARLASIPSIAASCCRLLACSACCFSPIARCSAATSSSASSRSRSSAARCVCWFFSRSSR